MPLAKFKPAWVTGTSGVMISITVMLLVLRGFFRIENISRMHCGSLHRVSQSTSQEQMGVARDNQNAKVQVLWSLKAPV
jgi:RNase adaptor protein for sRNA GlmZ degradation